MASGSVVIDIFANSSPFKRELAELNNSVRSSIDRVSSSFGRVGTALTVGVTAPLALAAKAAGQWALDTISSTEQAEIAFSTMLGSVDAARAKMQELADFAKTTPFDIGGLTTATQRLIAYGFAAGEVIDVMRDVGDAASGLGVGQEGINQITRALGQMKAKGKVAAQEMMQLTETGIPAWQMLARVISNGDVDKAMKMVEKRAVDANTAIAALREGMRKNYGGMMAKQAMTLTGILSNMSDAAQGAVRNLYQTEAWKKVTQALANLSDKIQPLVEKFLPTLEGLLERAGSWIEGLGSAIDNLSAEGVTNIVNALGLLAAMGPTMLAASRILSGIAPIVSEISVASTLLVKDWKNCISGIQKFGSAAAGVVNSILQGFANLGSSIVSVMSGVANKTLGPFRLLADTVGKIFGSVSYVVKDAFSAIITSAAGMAGRLKNILSPIGEVLISIPKGIGKAIQGFFAPMIGAIVAQVGKLMAAASLVITIQSQIIGAKLSQLGGLISAKFAGLQGSLLAMAPKIKGAFVAMVGPVAIIAAAIVAVTAALAGLALSAAMAGASSDEMANSFISGVQGIAGMIKGFLTQVANAIPEVLKLLDEHGQEMADAAVDAINGVLDAFIGLLPGLGAIFVKMLPLVINTIVRALPRIIVAGALLFGGLLTALADTAVSLVAAIPQFLLSVIQMIIAYAPTVLETALQLFSGFMEALPEVAANVLLALPNFILQIAAAIPTYLPMILQGAASLFMGFVSGIGSVLPTVLSSLGRLIVTVIALIPTFVAGLVASVVVLFLGVGRGILQTLGNALSAVANLFNSLVSKAKSFDLVECGRMLVQGLINGIGSMVQTAINSVGSFLGNVVKAAEHALGINSPSRVFAEIGHWTVLGFNKGIEHEEKGAVRAMANLMTSAIDEANKYKLNPSLDMALQGKARTEAEVSVRGMSAELAARFDDLGERFERAITRPVDINYNGREFGRMVREVV